MKEHRFSLPFTSFGGKAAQLTENGTEIVRLFARFALGAFFYPLWLIVFTGIP